MENTSELINVPSQTFYQGEWGAVEKPIIIAFYNGCIELDQQDSCKILIDNDYLEKFIKALRQGRKNADLLRK